MPECPECGKEYETAGGLGSHRSAAHELPWEDEDTLRELHEEQGLSFREIARRMGCNHGTISKWCEKYGIEKDRPWRDEKTVRELYRDERKSMNELSDMWGISTKAVWDWVHRHGIEPRENTPELSNEYQRKLPASRYQHKSGYVYLRSAGDYILEHRLLAIAEYGFDAVAGKDVHHKNGIPWDNRLGNLELVDKDEHARMHYSDYEIDDKGRFKPQT